MAIGAGGASGGVRLILRIEGLALLALSLWLYQASGFGWGQFALLFLAPDLSFAGYLLGARAGANSYNCAHSTLGPALLIACVFAGHKAFLPFALIWLAHVGFDRMLGYGLKYASAFGDTHLGKIGKAARGMA